MTINHQTETNCKKKNLLPITAGVQASDDDESEFERCNQGTGDGRVRRPGKCGPYPYILKKRILSSTGHLSNVDCAVELPKLVNAGLTRIILAHLSEENNKPDIALSTSKKSLDNAGFVMNKDYTMAVAPVETNGKYITF